MPGKSRDSRKRPNNGGKNLKSLSKVSRGKPRCAACNMEFDNIQLFEEHQQTEEHKMNDAPLELILERVEEANRGVEVAEGYRQIALQAAAREESRGGERTSQPNSVDISGLIIGDNRCYSQVEATYCSVCKIYLSEEDQEDPLAWIRHCSSFEHRQNE